MSAIDVSMMYPNRKSSPISTRSSAKESGTRGGQRTLRVELGNRRFRDVKKGRKGEKFVQEVG